MILIVYAAGISMHRYSKPQKGKPVRGLSALCVQSWSDARPIVWEFEERTLNTFLTHYEPLNQDQLSRLFALGRRLDRLPMIHFA